MGICQRILRRLFTDPSITEANCSTASSRKRGQHQRVAIDYRRMKTRKSGGFVAKFARRCQCKLRLSKAVKQRKLRPRTEKIYTR
jgi:hypothetical protein